MPASVAPCAHCRCHIAPHLSGFGVSADLNCSLPHLTRWADTDECAIDNGGCGDVAFYNCTNHFGANHTCEDFDECATNNGACGDAAFWSCVNEVGAARRCVDIDECATNYGGCDAAFYSCVNNAGAAPTCADINECNDDDGGCDNGYSCHNQVGRARVCSDINECTNNNNDCSQDADCANTPGSFVCACKPGFAGDGKACAGECSANVGRRRTCSYAVTPPAHSTAERVLRVQAAPSGHCAAPHSAVALSGGRRPQVVRARTSTPTRPDFPHARRARWDPGWTPTGTPVSRTQHATAPHVSFQPWAFQAMRS